MSETLGLKGWRAAAAAANVEAEVAPVATEIAIHDAGPIPRGSDWGETLQSASRLRLVMGEMRRIAVVTGIEASDEAGPLATQLALALAELEQGLPILLVDADDESSTLDALFGANRAPGLLDVLEGRAGLEQAAYRAGPDNLFLLRSGTGPNRLASLLTAEAALSLLSTARQRFRYVLLHAGLVRKSAPAMLLASLSDGLVLAVARGLRRRDEIAAFHQELHSLKIPTLGAVLTRTANR